MSHELAPLSDPGLPEHVHRKADIDPRAAKKAERQVGILFLFSVLGTLLYQRTPTFLGNWSCDGALLYWDGCGALGKNSDARS
jgi:hypothetical protein